VNKASLAIVALAIVAATVVSVYALAAQNAQARCNGGSVCQSNIQSSHVSSAIIDRSDVGNQAVSTP
jgi:hypothetical protein